MTNRAGVRSCANPGTWPWSHAYTGLWNRTRPLQVGSDPSDNTNAVAPSRPYTATITQSVEAPCDPVDEARDRNSKASAQTIAVTPGKRSVSPLPFLRTDPHATSV